MFGNPEDIVVFKQRLPHDADAKSHAIKILIENQADRFHRLIKTVDDFRVLYYLCDNMQKIDALQLFLAKNANTITDEQLIKLVCLFYESKQNSVLTEFDKILLTLIENRQCDPEQKATLCSALKEAQDNNGSHAVVVPPSPRP